MHYQNSRPSKPEKVCSKCLLKECDVVHFVMKSSGNEFQSLGAMLEKALLP